MEMSFESAPPRARCRFHADDERHYFDAARHRDGILAAVSPFHRPRARRGAMPSDKLLAQEVNREFHRPMVSHFSGAR